MTWLGGHASDAAGTAD